MPFVTLTTNASLSAEHQEALAKSFVDSIVTHAGKPEGSVMVGFNAGAPMLFRGSTATPTAFIEIKYIGDFTPEAKKKIVADMCAALSDRAKVPGARVYIKFTGTPGDQWGCDGQVFG